MSHIEFHGPRKIPDGMTIESYTIGSWCPTDDGSGLPMAVALELNIKSLPFPLVMRLKSRQAVNDMINALVNHRDDVFGKEGNN